MQCEMAADLYLWEMTIQDLESCQAIGFPMLPVCFGSDLLGVYLRYRWNPAPVSVQSEVQAESDA